MLVLCVRVAQADSSAKQYYEEGLAQYRGQRYAGAADDFEHAYSLRPTPLLLFDIGQCHRKLGEFAKARDYYVRFLAAATPADDAGSVRDAKQYVADIDAYLTTQRTPAKPAPVIARPAPVIEKPPPVVAKQPEVATPTLVVEKPAPDAGRLTQTPPKKRPLSRSPVLWGSVVAGVVVVGVAIGLGVGLTRPHDPSTTFGSQTAVFR